LFTVSTNDTIQAPARNSAASTRSSRGLFDDPGYDEKLFNFTEDMNISEMRPDASLPSASPLIHLLSRLLPTDLPTVHKDILILMAASYGNIDRYTRLRQPKPIYQGIYCCVRGIYHNTMFALRWASEIVLRKNLNMGW
jgi:hypothetical protein